MAVGFGFVLAAFDQVAFDHHAHNGVFAVFQLRGDVLGDDHLAGVVFIAVGVAAVDHQLGIESGFGQLLAGGLDVAAAVVGLFAAAQDDVTVGVAVGVDDGGVAGFGYGQKVVRVAGGADGVDGDFQVAVGAVFEADGAGQAAGKLAVHLAFGGARADGTPGNQVGIVLRGNHVEKFGGRGHAHVVEREQKLARLAQAVVDVESAVQMGVVDQAFPADGGARFFKIDAHHDQQLFFVLLFQRQ